MCCNILERRMKRNNKGFSLVELIVVIGIMAILVGLSAPQLIKYIEKSKVSSDRGLLDTIYVAVVTAVSDPDVVTDPDSLEVIESLSSPVKIEDLMAKDTLLRKEILDSIGWADLNQSTYESFLRSKHKSNAEIYVLYDGKFKNPLIMWITTTDKTGGGDTSHAPTNVTKEHLESDLQNCIAIY